MRTILRSWFITLATFITLLALMAHAYAFQLQIDGDRISVEASQVPLQNLLKVLSRQGVIVRMDPDINPLVTISFRNRDLEDGLKAVLKPHAHVFLWRVSENSRSPGAPTYQLDEIHVFRPGLKRRIVALDEPQPDVAEDAPSDSPQTPVQAETKVTIINNKVFVPVILGYQDREVETTLIFDTGAGTIVLHQNVAEELGIDATQDSSGRGVGGIQIDTRTTRLDYVRVGPHKKDNLRTDIIEYQGTVDQRYNGLLGMNFIRGLKYTIDFDQQVIRWRP